jgi:protein-disulfide isomerase
MSSTWEPVLTAPVTPDRDHVRGAVDAPLTMVEYGDYECPFCAMAHPVTKAIISRLGDDLLFVYRHFPLSTVHPHAATAAEAAEAAGAQGRFWEMHDLLYADQQRLEPAHLVARAEGLGLDVQRFVDDLRNGRHGRKVREDFLGGVRSGVNGTPTFFVNGRRHDGPPEADALMASLRAAAAQHEEGVHAPRRR